MDKSGGFKSSLKKLAGFNFFFAASLFLFSLLALPSASAQTQQQSGPVGVEGRIPSDPPAEAPFITFPSNGQTFTTLPIRVAGLCTQGLLVEVFKNGVFAGSTQCSNRSFSLQIDLFDGRNDLIARQYDALNQASPDSNTISVTFNSATGRTGPKVTLVTAYAKRGAAPGSSLSWPLSISGGTAPYAVSVDWGDKTPPDLLSLTRAGDFSIEHIYGQSGLYNVVIKVTDANEDSAYLQVVGIGNGPIQQTAQITQGGSGVGGTRTVVIWWPFLIALLLTILAFWLGQRHQLQLIRDRLRHGEPPFK